RPGRRAEPGAGRPAAALHEGERGGTPGAAGLAGHAAAPLGRPGSGARGGRVTSCRRRPQAAAWLLAALFPPWGAAAGGAMGDREGESAHRADRGTSRAAGWYWAEAASLARGFAAERVRGWRRGRTPAGLLRRTGDSTMRTLWEDLRLAFRSLRRQPGFAAAVVATLALGSGANVPPFAAVAGVPLPPLPHPDPHRL